MNYFSFHLQYLAHCSNAALKVQAHKRMLFILWFTQAVRANWIKSCFVFATENRNSFRLMIRRKDKDSRQPRWCKIQHTDQKVKYGGSTKSTPSFSKSFYSWAISVFIFSPLNTQSHLFSKQMLSDQRPSNQIEPTKLTCGDSLMFLLQTTFLSFQLNSTARGVKSLISVKYVVMYFSETKKIKKKVRRDVLFYC